IPSAIACRRTILTSDTIRSAYAESTFLPKSNAHRLGPLVTSPFQLVEGLSIDGIEAHRSVIAIHHAKKCSRQQILDVGGFAVHFGDGEFDHCFLLIELP